MEGIVTNRIMESSLSMDRKNEELDDFQLEILNEFVTDALDKAVHAMEKMLKIRVRAEHMDFGLGQLDHIPELDVLGRFKVHLVKVRFKGEIRGAFYFIINGHEVDLINSVCLPQVLSPENRTEDKMMKHGFMAEIENMIAALSLKEISEFLGVQILPEVPEVTIMPGSEVNNFLFEENISLNTAFYVKSVLAGVVVNIAPYFIWTLDQSFVDKFRLNSGG